MNAIRAIVLSSAALAAGAPAAAGHARQDTAAQAVAAERAFAARAQVVDPRDAFIEWFAPDAIGFAPSVGPAQPGLQASPPWGIDLRWRPADAGGAAAGDLGWTTGPAEWRRAKTDATPFRWGWYTSVWRRQPDGAWKVLADIGVTTPPPTVAIADWAPAPDAERGRAWRPGRHPPRVARMEARLLEQDRALARRAARDAEAFAAVVGERTRYHAEGVPPVQGRRAVLDALRDGTTTYRWTPVAAGVSASGDLGFTYGSGARRTTAGERPFGYLAIWTRDGGGRWTLRALVHGAPPKA